MSGRKLNVQGFHIIQAGDMSGNITSQAQNILNYDNIGIHLVFTGTPTGTFFVDVSNDHAEQNGVVTNAGDWTPISYSVVPVASGSAGSVYISNNQLDATYIRVRYVVTSGSGTLDAYITQKQV